MAQCLIVKLRENSHAPGELRKLVLSYKDNGLNSMDVEVGTVVMNNASGEYHKVERINHRMDSLGLTELFVS